MININHQVINHLLGQIYREPDQISSQDVKYYYNVDAKFSLSEYEFFRVGANVSISSIDVYCRLGDMSGDLAAMIRKELNNNNPMSGYMSEILIAHAERYHDQDSEFSFNNNLLKDNAENYQNEIISSLQDFLDSKISDMVIMTEIFPVRTDSNEELTQIVSHLLSLNLAIILNLLSSKILEPEEEGKKYDQLSSRYERSLKNRAACIAYHGVTCKVCDMNFSDTYGSTGAGFIHIHHLYPLSIGEGSKPVNPIKDLVPVCPNCHAMIHRGKELLTIEKLREAIKENQN